MADTNVAPLPGKNYVALPIGTVIGRYSVTGVLGQGTFGVTYRAHDGQLGRDVAIKEYLPTAFAARHEGLSVLPNSTESAADFAWGRQRFVDEGRTLAGFQRAPGIVRVHDFLEANGTAYIVMELVQGETLGARLRRGRLAAAEVERILRALLDGLEKVHAASFIHRDVKPDNILLDDDGEPTLIDFGAARAAVAGRTAALTGIYTPGYAAVEQFTDARQGPFTDVYGLSATLYEAIAGKKPPSAIDRTLEDRYEPLARLRPAGFAPALLAGIDRGMAVRPEARPQTIAEWRVRLFPASAAAARPRWRVAALAGLAVVLLLGAAAGAWFALAPREVKVAAVEKPRAEEAVLRPTEEDARARAAAAAVEDARVRAEAEQRDAARRLAEQEARDKAIAEEKAAAEAQARKAEEEAAKAKADAGLERKAAEAAEAALHLGPLDRQRLQVALTAQGFDTRGTDGVFGPRSREMVLAWQTARGLPATGFLDAAQQQRLLGDSAAALARFEAEQKKAADDEARRQSPARTDATTALVAPPPRPAAPAFDGQWAIVRSKCIPTTPQRFGGVTVQGNRFSHSFTFANRSGGCSVEIRSDGSFANTACDAPISGRIQGNRMTLSQKHPEVFCDFEFQKQ